MRELIIAYVRTHLDGEFDAEAQRLTDVLDSVSLLQLIVFLDQELGIALDLSSVTLEMFASVDRLVATLEAHAAYSTG